jgi:hypothetical protein
MTADPSAQDPGQTPAPQVDPDAGLFLPDGTPVSVAKRLIQAHEPGAQGYNAAFGQAGGLPAGYKTGPNGFPEWAGNEVGDLYGGAYKGQKSRAAGMYQFEPGTWNPIAEKLGITDFSPQSQERVASALLQQSGMTPWAPYNPRLAAAYSQYKGGGQGNVLTTQGPANTLTPASAPQDWSGLKANALAAIPSAGPTSSPQINVNLGPSGAQGEMSPYQRLTQMSLIQQLTAKGTHQFIPVDYDPWKYTPQAQARGPQTPNQNQGT